MSEKIKTGGTGFGSKLGFILAAAGSAVGLGNIWRFPYLAAKYGGGIFLLVYLVLAVTFGFALMVTETSIGRKTGKSVIGAYASINKKFAPLGWIAAAIPIIILPYYCVIGGWVLKYMTEFITVGSTNAADPSGSFFGNFISHVESPLLFFAIYLILTAVVVMFGVKNGVELASKILMPVLLILIIGIAVYTLTIDGAIDGLIYYVKPDFSQFSYKTVVAAMGQLFYSMSLAMGIMITYGSYMRKEDNIEHSVRHIEIFDTVVAFLSGLIIIPAVVAISGKEDLNNSGPGLMFQILPQVFDGMTGGRVIGTVFFVLVALAALTSSISLMETVVSIICEKFKVKRMIACLIVIAFSFVLGLMSIFGYSIWDNVTLLGMQMLDFFDYISNNIMMPVVALLTCVLIGFVVKTKYIEDEVELNGKFKSKSLYRVMIKYICPVCMLAILLSSFFITL